MAFDLVRLCVLDSAPFDNVQTDLSGKAQDEGADIALLPTACGLGSAARPCSRTR